MIDNANSETENQFNAHAVSVTNPDGGYTPLDETLKTFNTTPDVNSITGITDTGKAVMTAKDAAAARTAIGAGTPYTLPAASTSLGGVKQVTLADNADAAAIVSALKASGLAK